MKMRKSYDFSSGKRGAVVPSSGKTRITIMLDDDVIGFFRSEAETRGVGYQTRINAVLREAMGQTRQTAGEAPVTAAALRKILREELSGTKRAA
jgi:hypothetical protein